jgi:hypothetical protein
MEVVDFFRKPEKFRASGARPPKGVLLVGPPGGWAALHGNQIDANSMKRSHLWHAGAGGRAVHLVASSYMSTRGGSVGVYECRVECWHL